MQSRIFGCAAVILASLAVNSLGCGDVPKTTGTNSGGMGGTGGTGGTMCIPEDDNNKCTNDVCNADGTTDHVPQPSGTSCGTKGQCNGNGQCVECSVATDCPGKDDACQMRTCNAGTCGMTFTADGMPIPTQTAGDCKVTVCDGNGATRQTNDDTDVHDDNNACTSDTCNMGVPVNTQLPTGTDCTPPGNPDPLVCNDMGQCVGCNVATDCPGIDDECSHRICVANICDVEYTPENTPVAAQTPNDCLLQVCDGGGSFIEIADDTDLPLDDGNMCTSEICAGGVPMHPSIMNGTTCDDKNACTKTDKCQSGICVGATPVVCEASDDCHVAGSCDSLTGLCTKPAKPNGAMCNDSDPCTQTDTCQMGICVGGNAVQCMASDQCHTAGICDSTTGMCTDPTAMDGTPCTINGNAGTCTGGVCM